MKIPGAISFDMPFAFLPGTDPEDAWRAVAAHVAGSFRNRGRQKAKMEKILEDTFVASLVHCRPWRLGQILSLQEKSGDKNFCERLARAFAEGKPNIFDEVDLFILANWRNMTPQEAEFCLKAAGMKQAPGLEDWNPEAACNLIAFRFTLTSPPSVEWYKKRRRRLGLVIKKVQGKKSPYRVRSRRGL